MQVAHLIKNLTGLLAAAFAAFFVVGAIYCVVFLGTVDPSLRFWVASVDMMNISIYATPPTILPSAYLLTCYLVYRCLSENTTSKMIVSNLIIMLTVALGLRRYFAALVNLPSESLGAMFLLMMIFGILISIIASLILNEMLNSRGAFLCAFMSAFPVLVLPPIILVMASIDAATSAIKMRECRQPTTLTYTANHRLTSDRVCHVMSLERGLLLRDKEANATIFVPWSQLTKITNF